MGKSLDVTGRDGNRSAHVNNNRVWIEEVLIEIMAHYAIDLIHS